MSDPSFDGSALGLTEAQGKAMVAAFEPCGVDIVDLFARSLTMGLTPEQQDCAAANVEADVAKQLLAKTFSNQNTDTELGAIQDDLIKDCKLPG